MRRLSVVRALHGLFALWFILSVGEPSVLRACPTHASAAAEVASEHDMARMAMPQHDGAHGSRSSGRHQHGHHCSCMGCCVGCSSAALHSPSVAIGAPARGAARSSAYSAVDDTTRANAPHLLPPGTGPPLARVQA